MIQLFTCSKCNDQFVIQYKEVLRYIPTCWKCGLILCDQCKEHGRCHSIPKPSIEPLPKKEKKVHFK